MPPIATHKSSDGHWPLSSSMARGGSRRGRGTRCWRWSRAPRRQPTGVFGPRFGDARFGELRPMCYQTACEAEWRRQKIIPFDQKVIMATRVSQKRARCLDRIASGLPQRASMLTRFFFATTRTRMSGTEAGLLNMLYDRPYRITELAVRESITQPAVTQLVNRLEARGWVFRTSDPDDRRAVLVELTDLGVEEFEELQREYRTLMRGYMAELEDEELETLSHALEILDHIIERFGER